MGSIIPSSPALCRRLVAQVRRAPDEAVLELGAGTGVVSRALLEGGVPADKLILVEIEPTMARHLRQVLPGVTVIEGDARELSRIIPSRWHGQIGSVICGIPMVLLSLDDQRGMISEIAKVAPGRGFLHFSYCATSPLSESKLRLAGTRAAWTPLNFPPASVWRYAPA